MTINMSAGSANRPLMRTSLNPTRHRERVEEQRARNEREVEIRKLEDERISRIREQMAAVRIDEDMDDIIKGFTLDMYSNQIKEIHAGRAEREQMQIDLELRRIKQDQEERMREAEERAEQNAPDDEDPDVAHERVTTRSLMTMSARMDNISSMRMVRERMGAEAAQLTNDLRNSFGVGLADDRSISIVVNTGFGEGDWRNRQLSRLNEGISRLTTSINSSVAALYRDNQALFEAQKRIDENASNKPIEEDEDVNFDS